MKRKRFLLEQYLIPSGGIRSVPDDLLFLKDFAASSISLIVGGSSFITKGYPEGIQNFPDGLVLEAVQVLSLKNVFQNA